MSNSHAGPFFSPCILLWTLAFSIGPLVRAQSTPVRVERSPQATQEAPDSNEGAHQPHEALTRKSQTRVDEYRIGRDDLLDISIFEAPEMNRTLRVSPNGEISFQPLGTVKASGLTPQELEMLLQGMLRKTYMRDPHVSVFVHELQSRAVSVIGAVKMPGVYQIRDPKSVIELLSMAEGLSDDAGDTVLIMHGVGPSTSETDDAGSSAGTNEIEHINLKNLMESANPALNVMVYPGDVVKVTRAGIVYVVGEVAKPGGFVLKSNENISVLQALALAEGLTRTSAKSQARIIRTDPKTAKRIEIPVDLGKVLESKAPDLLLQPKDIVFVPNSTGKSALYRTAQAALTTVSGVAIYGRW